ncbi:hypothetical protein [Pseudonocardia xinjiangensis]|uniref:Uncharacterized protein n=1 Tax=Pseudonocardia xinjiangensis TaxID=75289 RepID=A0ABX1RE75_9PSEU|nr:hypothetical protein [Pseudonocardia xinjiangensis]NMH77710.1 hypothetical protein [Pseudonocardia xinjiangensis]
MLLTWLSAMARSSAVWVRGKEGILFRLAEAAVEHPDDVVRDAYFQR